MSDDRPCNMKEMSTVFIMMFDGMVRKLKEVRYISQLKKKSYLCWCHGSMGLEVSIRDGVLKMIRDSMVV